MRLWMAFAGVVAGLCLPGVARASGDVLLDNPSVRVSLNTYAPGELSGEHEHFVPRFVYVISDGMLQSEVGDEPPQTTNMTAGSCMYAAPVRHSLENAGATTLRLLEIEIKNATWGSRAPLQPCNPTLPREKGPVSKLERTLLYAGSDLIVSRIVIPPGSRDRTGSIRGPRLIFVLDGRSMATRLPNGSKAIATYEAALWVDEDAPLINQDSHAPLTVLEITPTSSARNEAPRPGIPSTPVEARAEHDRP